MAARTDVNSTVLYEVWYDGRDGCRRHLLAASMDDVKQAISDIKADDDRVNLLGQTVGLPVAEHHLNVEIIEVSTTTKTVDLK